MEVFSWLADIAMPVNGSHTAPVDTREELRGPAPFRDRRRHGVAAGVENERKGTPNRRCRRRPATFRRREWK